MKKKGFLLAAVCAAFWCGGANAVSLAPIGAAQTLIIHASGAGTGVHLSGGSSAITSGGSSGAGSSTSTPGPQSLPGIIKPAQPSGSAGSAPVSTSSQQGFGPATGRGSGQAVQGGEEPSVRFVEVTLLDGTLFTAGVMRAGIHDSLRVRNGKAITSVPLSTVAGMEFGEKELGALPVSVTLNDGGLVEGSVYPGTVFEFEAEGRITSVRAASISSIVFQGE